MRPQSEPWISTRSERGVVVVSIHGALTGGSPNKEALPGEFSKLLEIGLRRFTLDLEPVPKMDEDGINTIIEIHTQVTDRNGELTFRGAAMVPLHGRLTIGMVSEESIESEFSRLWDIGLRSFILDLEDVSKMDSSGVAEFVALYRKVAERGGELDLVNLPRNVRDILEITQKVSTFDR